MKGIQGIGTVMGVLGAALALAGLAAPRSARACGGLFCNSSQSQIVNQAAERIIFSDNADGTVTAVVEIQYEGLADKFAWLLPMPGVPEVEVSSTQVFDQLQAATAPTYTLQTQVEGTCADTALARSGAAGATAAPTSGDASFGNDADDSPPPVTVLVEDQVGPYDYTVISVMEGLDDSAEVAIDWLGENGYDVTDLGPEVLRPYLDDGLNLLAFKLTKGNVTGAIRPVRLTYEAELPSIPIRPTAVAANDDMGVMVFQVSEGRAIPTNYKALELNEALIDWFNPTGNYGEVINLAADEAGGQGFVTEFAGGTAFLQDQIFPNWQREQWNDFQSGFSTDGLSFLREAFNLYGSWDGFDQALQAGVTPNDPDLIETALNCASCPSTMEITVDQAALVEGLFEHVIQPVLATHELLVSRPTLTRLYTTMSADEMTVDPVFDDNPELEDVDNQHNATQFIECSPEVMRSEAPWRIELPQGDVVRGAGSSRVWPVAVDEQPANSRILQLVTSGQGEVVEDNRAMITEALIEQAADFSIDGVDGVGDGTRPPGSNPGPGGGAAGGGATGSDGDGSAGGLCSAAPGLGAGGALPYLALSTALLWARRRRRT